MNLKDLLSGLTKETIPNLSVSGISSNSKQLRPGELFVALRGANTDGHRYVEEAASRGACALLVEKPISCALSCPVFVVENTKTAIRIAAERFFGEPAKKLRLIGITGTNGKTTTAYLIKSILEASGERVGLLGTVAYEIGQRHLPSLNTTPGSLELQKYLSQMVNNGLSWCVMEVSSHALDQGRVDGLAFDSTVFTNLGSDHMDYHKTLEHYASSKRKLFSHRKSEGFDVINTDDSYGQSLAESLHGEHLVTYGSERPASVFARKLSCSWKGTELILESRWGAIPVSTPLIGRHNILNISAAAGVCLALGVPGQSIKKALYDFAQVPGRLECVSHENGILTVIDYAHTADALRLVLLSLRELTGGRLIVVFGCGGDRDKTKRPAMGRIASLLADRVVLTCDNPRSEDPAEIISNIKSGFVPNFESFHIELDREKAILSALEIARPNDVVLVAGKGHESYQIFNNITVPFSDRDAIKRCLNRGLKVSVTEDSFFAQCG
jgi:UDP-N-acetylmuramoyl-L-alanyl-D-glutamate--2,6-diaminopimelate ligase